MAVPADAVVTKNAVHLRRLALAMAASAFLHLALIAGIRIKLPASSTATQTVIEARLAERPAAAAPAAVPKSPAVPVAQVQPEQKSPATAAPETVPQPTPDALPVQPAAPPTHEAPAAQAGPPPDAGIPVASSPLPAMETRIAQDPTYYQASQLDETPKKQWASEERPEFPEEAHRENVEGHATLELWIDEYGVVRDVKVVEESPPGFAWGKSADAFFRARRFDPAIKGGRAVKSRMQYHVSYILTDLEITPASPQKPAE